MDNLPAEIAHVLEEIRDKDIKFYELRKRIQQRDNQIHKFIRNHGSLAENPKESAYPKIRADFEKAMMLQQEKCDLANQGLYIVSKHLKKLNDEIKRLEKDGMIAPSTEPSLSEASPAPSARVSSRHARTVSSVSSAGLSRTQKLGSPAPGTRGNTPVSATGAGGASSLASAPNNGESTALSTGSVRPTKRQKLSGAAAASAAGSAVATPTSGTQKAAKPSIRLVSPGIGTPMNIKDCGDASSTSSTPKNRKDKNDGVHAILANAGLDTGTGAEGEDEIYCICRQVSFGNMVGCDNPDCKIEWFHYGCVGLKEPPDPKSSWYCPDCTREMEKKGIKDTKKRGRA